jgi:osmoprotectant transport system ATP-binding protein
MGTRIAIPRAGRLVQFDRPETILAHPADAFVEAFVGSDRALASWTPERGRRPWRDSRLRTRPPSASRATCATRCRRITANADAAAVVDDRGRFAASSR